MNMKKLMVCVLLITSINSWAQLPSWGMTEIQYKMPNFETKMSEIGAQAYDNNWLLKVTAPADWHNKIRMALSNGGERDVQVSFNDSVHQSITITAAKGAKVAKISSSSSNTTVQKQVVIEKPEIDTEVEAPDFGDTKFSSNNDELLENIAAMEIKVPNGTVAAVESSAAAAESKPVTTAETPTPKPTQATTPVAANEGVDEETLRETLRKRHARTKRVDKEMSYENISTRDDLFVNGTEVLIKRFVNQGVVIYFWMKEDYDPAIHQFKEKSSGKYQKDEAAVASSEAKSANQTTPESDAEVKPTELGFVAVDTVIDDQDELRKDHARNKRADLSINVDQLKTDDILYVLNQTVLVERPITSAQSAYFWLVGDTTITREVERKGDNKFVIK